MNPDVIELRAGSFQVSLWLPLIHQMAPDRFRKLLRTVAPCRAENEGALERLWDHLTRRQKECRAHWRKTQTALKRDWAEVPPRTRNEKDRNAREKNRELTGAENRARRALIQMNRLLEVYESVYKKGD